MLNKKNIIREEKSHFENWLKEKIELQKTLNKGLRTKEVITIPVVVHIIHNGETVGTGSNIADSQIISQMDVLNEDFRRLNADAANTPTVFEPVAADIEVDFVLAQRDPEGLATNGIVRVNGNRSEWFLVDNYDLKSLSNWPSKDYLNIWVAALGDDYLGYAQFPVSDIGGLEIASNSALTDGVVVDYRSFGSEDKYPPANLDPQYNLGRTTTHEVGHYLGLRHIWGDGGCGVDDFCADTPNSNQRHLGLGSPCTFPQTSSCGSDDMFQNYMAFTNDICMNLFTQDQKTRIRAVLDNSPRRVSLKNSKGGLPPVVVSNDLGIRNIIAPENTVCNGQIDPVIEVRNYGDNQISSARLEVLVNSIVEITTNESLTLQPGEAQNIIFDPIAITESVTVEFRIVQTNNTTDGNADDNTASINVSVPPTSTSDIALDFNTLPDDWEIVNLDELFTWEIRNAPNGEPGNTALRINFFDYENEGDFDLFTSPLIDLSNDRGVKLTFDVAYAPFSGSDPGPQNEGLLVTVSDDCSDPLTGSDTVYYKLAEQLGTVEPQGSPFTPGGGAEWRRETIDLTNYEGQSTVRISFIAKNGFGNNLYIDNISLNREPLSIVRPSLASCIDDPPLEIQFFNSTINPVGGLLISYALDGQNSTTESFTFNPPVQPSESINVSIPLDPLTEGPHSLTVTSDLPELGEVMLDYNFHVDKSEDILPVKETFEDFAASNWFVVNPDDEVTWSITELDGSSVMAMDASGYPQTGEKDWLVSPVLDFRNVQAALLNFDLLYTNASGRFDGLSILVSTDCGENYTESVFSRIGSLLTAGELNPGQVVSFDNITVDLAEFIGEEEIRIAFVSNNDNGDPIYLDNIQIFVTSNFFVSSEHPIFPNPTIDGRFNLLFDLQRRELVEVAIYDAMGHILSEKRLPNTLNQTYTFNLSQQRQGIYFVKVRGESFSYVRRVMKGN